MTIRLQFDRIPPGVEIGPHRHGLETIVYVAAGELTFEHGEELERRAVVRAGDVLYEAPAEHHLVRNEGSVDALALLASVEPEPRQSGLLFRRWDGRGRTRPSRRRTPSSSTRPGSRAGSSSGPATSGPRRSRSAKSCVAPGAADAWHRHLGAEHALVVFEGRGLVTVDETTETLEPLTGIRVEPGLTHRVENTGRLPLRYYVCSSPGTDPLEDREPAEAPPRTLDA